MSKQKDHIAQAAMLASAAYPNWSPTRATLEVWATLLVDLSGPELVEAMAGHCRHSEFPPTVASLLSRHKMLKKELDGESPGILAWAEVHKAIREGAPTDAPAGSGRSYWSHGFTHEALQSLGGWICVKDCQSSQISSMRSRFCEAFAQLDKRSREQRERDTLGAISASGLRIGSEDKNVLGLE